MKGSSTGAGVQPAPHRPQTEQKILTRYTPTFASNAFGHAEYKTPIKNTESAAIRTLKTSGTSVEDYGRRNQKWDTKAFLQAHLTPAGRPATANTMKREVVKVDDPDCPNCVNHNLISHKRTQSQLEKEAFRTAEQERFAANKAAQEAEMLKRQNELSANQSEMNNTLYSINAKKRAEWEAKKNDRTNYEETQKLNNEIQELTQKSLVERFSAQQQYKDDLNRKRQEVIQANINGKISDREMERKLKGLTFE